MGGDAVIEALQAVELDMGGAQQHAADVAEVSGLFDVLHHDGWNRRVGARSRADFHQCNLFIPVFMAAATHSSVCRPNECSHASTSERVHWN